LANLTDQFGTEEVQTSSNGRLLCEPALKNPQDCNPDTQHCPTLSDIESELSNFQCYNATQVAAGSTGFPSFPFSVNLVDQFFPDGTTASVTRTHFLCNPTAKSTDEVTAQQVVDESQPLKCYDIVDGTRSPLHNVTVEDQFGTWQIQTGVATQLCETATKELVEGRPPAD